MKKVMEAQGQPVDDATLDMVIGAMTTQLSQPTADRRGRDGGPGRRQVADLQLIAD